MHDLILRNARWVDTVSGDETVSDIGVAQGRIASVQATGESRRSIDAGGALVLPGLVDTHVHLTPEISGRYGFRMLVRAGVTSAQEMAGPVDEVLAHAARFGSGIDVATLEALRPGKNISSADPSRDELARFIAAAKAKGCYGIKILGGHYPLTPEATRAAIALAAEADAHVAIHCGSTTAKSDLAGLVEAVALAEGNRLQVCHVNSYCRGTHHDPTLEARKALELLDGRDNLLSESYLSLFNAARSDLDDSGGFASRIISQSLLRLGYEPDPDGLRRAFADERAHLNLGRYGEMHLVTGEEGWMEWSAKGRRERICFPVNSRPAQVILATAKGRDRDFVVDALASDGGGIPRNVTLDEGLRLVEMGLLSLADFVRKACEYPARRILRRDDIGVIREGARADLVMVDAAARKAVLVVARGEVLLESGTLRPGIATLVNGREVALQEAA